jgi:hypothetical protein
MHLHGIRCPMPAACTTLACAPLLPFIHRDHLLPAAGEFIEDDGGEGDYMDLGDDELFGSGASDEAAAGGKGKKRKGSDKGAQGQGQLGSCAHECCWCRHGLLCIVLGAAQAFGWCVTCAMQQQCATGCLVQRLCVLAAPVVFTYANVWD